MSTRTAPEIVAVVEVDGTSTAGVLSRLLEDAYCASQYGVIGLWLRGTTPQKVDRILDRVIAIHGLKVCGVRYLSAEDPGAVAGALAGIRLAVVSTDSLRAALAEQGISSLHPDQVECALADYIEPRSPTIR